jgi:hypothetical protein
MRHQYLARIAAASAFALILLSGCSTYRSVSAYVRSDKASNCPDALILANTAVLPAFDPAKGDDPSSLIYTVSMTNVKMRCDYSKRNAEVDSHVVITYQATRPPGGEDVEYRVPYFATVTNNGEIVDKQNFRLELKFRKGETFVSGTGTIDSMIVNVKKASKPYDYHLLIGFQLTKAQLDYNKKMGLDVP